MVAPPGERLRVITRFDRYELKYVVPLATGDAIAQDLAQHTTPDPHGDQGAYRVVSLYYDSPTLDLYWANLDRAKYRRKLRLRLYVNGDIQQTERGMVEIKQRINRAVHKRRIELALAQAESLCAGELDPTTLDARDRPIATEVQDFTQAMQLRPTAITDYHRRAFVGTNETEDLRVTIDTAVRGRCDALRVNRAANNHSILPPGLCVLEVKINGALPPWMRTLLAHHQCPPQGMSKYCTVVSQLLQPQQGAALRVSGS